MSHQIETEREIARKFTEIADIGWFSDQIPADFAQLCALKRHFGDVFGMKILDAGCARGRFARHLADAGAHVCGIDITEPFLVSAHRNIPNARFARASLSAIPFPATTFDAAYTIEVLQHLPDTDLALSEFARVLKPGGKLVIIDKSLQGLDPGTGLPNWWVKPRAEARGKWMYPPDFPFRERWFWPHKLKAQLKKYFDEVTVHYVPEGRGKASKLYKLLPFLSMDVAWVARKR